MNLVTENITSFEKLSLLIKKIPPSLLNKKKINKADIVAYLFIVNINIDFNLFLVLVQS